MYYDKNGWEITMTAKKTGKAATAVIPVDLMRRLRDFTGQFWLFPSPNDQSKPITRQAAFKAFRRASKAAGIEMVSPHSMRRTYAQSLYKAGASVHDIQKALQHGKLETTLLYLYDIGCDGRPQA
jgi:site-specific recombinase XerD